jgi:hypothetical protein
MENGKEAPRAADSRWRLWSAQEAAERVASIQWSSSSSKMTMGVERCGIWERLTAAGIAVGEDWAPMLGQHQDYMRAWVGVLEDQQEGVAYLWAHMGSNGRSLEETMEAGLMPVVEPLRCMGVPMHDETGRWQFFPPQEATVRNAAKRDASLKAIGEAGPGAVLAAARAAWERVALRSCLAESGEPAHSDKESLAHAPRRV